MKVLIQQHDGEFHNINTYSAYQGFKAKGYEIIFFEYDSDMYKYYSRDTIVVGGIPNILRALENHGVTDIGIESIPSILNTNFILRRNVWNATIGEVRQAVDKGKKLFIKPDKNHHKHFTGMVVSNYIDLAKTASLDVDYQVICSDVINMISEYRVYVLNGQIIGIKHYNGDCRVFPNMFKIDEVIELYQKTNPPIAYGIDFAVTNKGWTILVEVNDSYSLGCYGLSPIRYASMIEARWKELVS